MAVTHPTLILTCHFGITCPNRTCANRTIFANRTSFPFAVDYPTDATVYEIRTKSISSGNNWPSMLTMMRFE